MIKPKIKLDPISFIFLMIPIGMGLIFIFGTVDINGNQMIFKKVSLETFESWDCDLQLKYLVSTVPPETHRQSYIDNCMEKKP